MSEDENLKLSRMVRKTKRNILEFLEKNKTCQRIDLEKYVLNELNRRQMRDGTIVHRTRPIHSLAFVLGYKELEDTQEIKIERSPNVPYPMTDFETLFSLGVRRNDSERS